MNRHEYRCGGAYLRAKRGNELPHARLTPESVRAIRVNRMGETFKQLAKRFGVHYRTIQKVWYRETWAHVK